MATFGGPLPTCPKDQRCLEWVRQYLKDCVCNTRNQISFALGMISVFCWGIAEVPQIITNCREQSTEGVSLSFLMTWVLGDFFNLAGCYLEPSTLPTQFYMALLYTITTLILVGQVVYYDYILKWRKTKADDIVAGRKEAKDIEAIEPLKPQEKVDAVTVQVQSATTLPSRPIAASQSMKRDLYYMSARSLASSHTPTAGSYLATSRGSGGRDSSLLQPNSVEDSNGQVPSLITSHSAPHVIPSSILRAVVSSAICLGGFNIHWRLRVKQKARRAENYSVLIGGPGRKLFKARFSYNFHVAMSEGSGMTESLGVWFGWMMAAIYMGGRIPQIWLNIKRGTVEGLNPLMFTFALLGNVTYVGSILVRNTEWEKIKYNMPWLVDAGVCVLLDCFILCQFMYYYTKKSKYSPKDQQEDNGDYKAL